MSETRIYVLPSTQRPRFDENVTVLSDSCEFMRLLSHYKFHLLLTFEDMEFLKQDSNSQWVLMYYRKHPLYLITVWTMAKLLKKNLTIYVKEFSRFKELFLRTDVNLENTWIYF